MPQPPKALFFDWGDTLMIDIPGKEGPMAYWPQVFPVAGVAETLPLLARRYPLGVLSNAAASDAALMRQALERAGLARWFRWFFTSKELGAEKPAPAFFLAALEQAGIAPEDAVMIGNDYEKDIRTPSALGMGAVLLSPGACPGADTVIHHFSQLSTLFL